MITTETTDTTITQETATVSPVVEQQQLEKELQLLIAERDDLLTELQDPFLR